MEVGPPSIFSSKTNIWLCHRTSISIIMRHLSPDATSGLTWNFIKHIMLDLEYCIKLPVVGSGTRGIIMNYWQTLVKFCSNSLFYVWLNFYTPIVWHLRGPLNISTYFLLIVRNLFDSIVQDTRRVLLKMWCISKASACKLYSTTFAYLICA